MSELQTVDGPEVLVPLDHMEAQRLDGRIRRLAESARGQLVKVAELVEEAKRGQVHTVLGFASWTAYLADALGGQLQLPGGSRHEVVTFLAGEGLSVRAIAAATGVSKSTVSNDLGQVSNDWTPQQDSGNSGVQPLDTSETPAATVTGLDGKSYTKPKRKQRQPKREGKAATERKPKAKAHTPKPERKVQIPTAYREKVGVLRPIVAGLKVLMKDPRWAKATDRFNYRDRKTLDEFITALQEFRAAMGDPYGGPVHPQQD